MTGIGTLRRPAAGRAGAVGAPDPGGASFGLAGGCTVLIAAGLLVAAIFPAGDLSGRAAAMAATAGVLAALLRDARAAAGVTLAAALIVVGFLAHRDGQLTGGSAAWAYAAVIGMAAVVGRGQRRLRRAD